MGGSRLSRARTLLAARSRKEKAAGLAGLALVLTAPFGGLSRAPDPPPRPLTAGHTVTIGPYRVTFGRAYRVKEYLGTEVQAWNAMPVKPSTPARQLLVIDADVVNAGKRPEYPRVLSQAVSVSGASKVRGFGGPTSKPSLIYRADGSGPNELNPGMTHRLALVVEQPRDAHQSSTTIRVAKLTYIGKGGGASNLDEDYWLQLDGVARRGTIPIGPAPKGQSR